MKKLFPTGDHVLVLDSTESTVLDGIQLPENQRQKDMVFGTVVGRGKKVEDPAIQERATVCYGPYAGIFVIVEGVQFRLMHEGQVMGYIEEANESESENVA
jgi:co-chaperonin GroES (HSP10)